MPVKLIELDFGTFTLNAELFDTETAKKVSGKLPYTINLTQWGKELYGSIGIDLGEENPVPEIPPVDLPIQTTAIMCAYFLDKPRPGQLSTLVKLLAISGRSLIKIQ